MSNWPIIQGASRFETLGIGSGAGTAVTASSSVNVKGNYATLGTASFKYAGFSAMICNGSGAGRFRLDIAVNTGSADTVIVEDLYVDMTTNSGATGEWILPIPVAVPAGAIVKARCQCTVASRSFQVAVIGYANNASGDPGFRALKSLTDWTNTDPTTSIATGTGTGTTSWAQITASTSVRVASLFMLMDSTGTASGRTTSSMAIDIGWGAAGSEKVLATVLQLLQTSTPALVTHGPFPCDIPAGTRLATRATVGTAQGISSNFATPLYGLVI